ncbi:MAG: hypothetical protein IT561_20445, partial [Alphaproteobacteria bacterium]|nr:hypothetical protein [Alphaproteobacteria bacterium]
MTVAYRPPATGRRRLLAAGGALALLAGTARWSAPAYAAAAATPQQTEGPFYPTALPLDADNDLVRVAGAAAAARGTVTHVAGRILDGDGRPLAGARVEIWQCDANGIYLHPGSGDQRRRDTGFQGFGTAVTATDGSYRFRTIRPVAYSGRTPH